VIINGLIINLLKNSFKFKETKLKEAMEILFSGRKAKI
jgi:hypothetical protein